jgi:predicted HicB family RNase H-like nuclease
VSADQAIIRIIVPKKIYEMLEERAKQEGIQVNELILRAIMRELGI